jgi:hypothetical protein
MGLVGLPILRIDMRRDVGRLLTANWPRPDAARQEGRRNCRLLRNNGLQSKKPGCHSCRLAYTSKYAETGRLASRVGNRESETGDVQRSEEPHRRSCIVQLSTTPNATTPASDIQNRSAQKEPEKAPFPDNHQTKPWPSCLVALKKPHTPTPRTPKAHGAPAQRAMSKRSKILGVVAGEPQGGVKSGESRTPNAQRRTPSPRRLTPLGARP